MNLSSCSLINVVFYILLHVQVTYDTLGRLSQWRQSLTTDVISDVVVDYVYDVDNNVISVNRSDIPVAWYRDDVTSGDDHVTDGDGMVVTRRRSTQRLEWNSLSQLTRVVYGHGNSTYVYDAVGRLTVVNDVTSSLHLLYADLDHPQRLTHVHQSTTHHVTEYFYEPSDGHLRAVRVNADKMLYVAVDPHGSPVYVFTKTGHVVRRMSYTPVGGLQHTGSVDSGVPWYIGYRGAFYHTATGLLFFASRVLDPDNGRWLSPNVQPFTDRRGPSVTALIHNSDLYETNFLRQGDATPPSLMLSK